MTRSITVHAANILTLGHGNSVVGLVPGNSVVGLVTGNSVVGLVPCVQKVAGSNPTLATM